MTLTNRKLIGNHALASAKSKLRNVMIPSFFTTMTQKTQTVDWIHKSKKFMEKLRPDTTYYPDTQHRRYEDHRVHTLLTTVIRIDAMQ